MFHCFIRETIGYRPKDIKVFENAFIHKSVLLRGGKPGECNERLEYLGDAILEAVVSERLYHMLPDAEEGELSKLRATLVCRERLNVVARNLGMVKYIKYNAPHKIETTHLPGDAVEAIVAAIYLDGGQRKAEAFIRSKIVTDEDILSLKKTNLSGENYKSAILEWGQKHRKEIIFESGEAIVNGVKEFRTTLFVDGIATGEGYGKSKKKADQEAARRAIEKLQKAEQSKKKGYGNQKPASI